MSSATLVEAHAPSLNIKLSPGQKRLLDVISDPIHAHKTNEEKASLAGLTASSLYNYMRDPNFIQAIRLRGMNTVLLSSIPIVKRVTNDALKGKFMQQKLALEMSGHYSQAPMIQQVIANITNNKGSEYDLDAKIAEYLSVPSNMTPQQVVVDAQIVDDSAYVNQSKDTQVIDNTIDVAFELW